MKNRGETIDRLDVEELAIKMCKLGEDADTDDIETAFYNKFSVELDAFECILQEIWPMLTIGISPITETAYVGFADDTVWLAKKDVSGAFINSVVEWLGGNDIKESGKGMRRDVTKDGKVEFEITIVKD
jgi:hypothetical protein